MIFEKMIDSDWFKPVWTESYCILLNKEDIEDVVSATMTFANYCNGIMFVFKEGTRSFIPLAHDEEFTEGKEIDITNIGITVLTSKTGIIQRINIKK